MLDKPITEADVGKRFRTRDGGQCVIVGRNTIQGNKPWPFRWMADDNRTYRDSGRVCCEKCELEHDLVARLDAPARVTPSSTSGEVTPFNPPWRVFATVDAGKSHQMTCWWFSRSNGKWRSAVPRAYTRIHPERLTVVEHPRNDPEALALLAALRAGMGEGE